MYNVISMASAYGPTKKYLKIWIPNILHLHIYYIICSYVFYKKVKSAYSYVYNCLAYITKTVAVMYEKIF